MNTNPTPETDAAATEIEKSRTYSSFVMGTRQDSGQSQFVTANFARRLERERDAARARVAELEAVESRMIQSRGSLHCQTEFENKWQYSWYTEGREGRSNINYSVGDTPFQAVSPEIKAAQNQTPLDRPDRPGWWWVWVDYDQYGWAGVYVDEHELKDAVESKWLPATPPPVPTQMKEEQP